MNIPFKKIYKNTGLTTHEFDNLLIPLNPNWKRAVINLSGGADSALLAFMICKTAEDNNYDFRLDVLSYIRMWKTRPWQSSIAENVYNWLKNRFPDIIGERYTMYIPPELECGAIGTIKIGKEQERCLDAVIGLSYSRYLQYQNKYAAVYNATTLNPSSSTHDSRCIDRDNVPARTENVAMLDKDTGWLLVPFRLTEKDWVLQQYINNDILDLLNITRSCEGEFTDITLETYTVGQHIPECGTCFWCEERNWAKKEVGIDD